MGTDDPPYEGRGTGEGKGKGRGEGMGTQRGADEQDEVLPKKGNVTEGSRGLQQWSDEGIPDGPMSGTGSAGTAERAAKITRGQLDAEAAKAIGAPNAGEAQAGASRERPEEE